MRASVSFNATITYYSRTRSTFTITGKPTCIIEKAAGVSAEFTKCSVSRKVSPSANAPAYITSLIKMSTGIGDAAASETASFQIFTWATNPAGTSRCNTRTNYRNVRMSC